MKAFALTLLAAMTLAGCPPSEPGACGGWLCNCRSSADCADGEVCLNITDNSVHKPGDDPNESSCVGAVGCTDATCRARDASDAFCAVTSNGTATTFRCEDPAQRCVADVDVDSHCVVDRGSTNCATLSDDKGFPLVDVTLPLAGGGGDVTFCGDSAIVCEDFTCRGP